MLLARGARESIAATRVEGRQRHPDSPRPRYTCGPRTRSKCVASHMPSATTV